MNNEKVKELAQRVFDAIDETPGLYEAFQDAAFEEIKRSVPKAYADWTRACAAETDGDMSADSFDWFQNSFFDCVIDPVKRALTIQVLSYMLSKLADESIMAVAEEIVTTEQR